MVKLDQEGKLPVLIPGPNDDPNEVWDLNQRLLTDLAETDAIQTARGIRLALENGVSASHIINFYGSLEEVEKIAGENIAQQLRNELKEE